MPYRSEAQRKYFSNKGKLEKQGVNVQEWNKASKGLSKLKSKLESLPDIVKKYAKAATGWKNDKFSTG
jgi:predicted translin family RNA/ssDNA-binding protein